MRNRTIFIESPMLGSLTEGGTFCKKESSFPFSIFHFRLPFTLKNNTTATREMTA